MIDRHIKLFTTDGDSWIIDADEEPRIDAAVERHLSQAGNPDTLLTLTSSDGDILKIRASACLSWLLSTPDGRRRSWEFEAAAQEEAKRLKQAAGLWEE